MDNGWFRIKDYFRYSYLGHWVEFRNYESTVVKAIQVWDGRVKLKINAIYFDILENNVNHFIPKAELLPISSGKLPHVDYGKFFDEDRDRNAYFVDFSTQLSARNLISLLKFISNNYERIAYPDSLYQELYNINLAIRDKNKKFKHQIERMACLPNMLNIGLNEIGRVFIRTGSDYDLTVLKDLKKLLMQGVDLNAYNMGGYSPLHTALDMARLNRRNHIQIVKLFVIYGANPFIRNNQNMLTFCSAFELALSYKNQNPEYAELFASLNKNNQYDRFIKPQNNPFPPQKCFTQENKPLVWFMSPVLISKFSFAAQKTYITYLKPLTSISAEEKKRVTSLFNIAFKMSSKDFDIDFSGKDKIIETIYCDNKLIGFNLIQKLIVNDTIVTNCLYSYISPHYRQPGLMLLLCLRLAFSLQLVLPDQKIGHFFSAINYDSYRMIQSFLHFPKYDPAMRHQSVDFPIQKIVKQVYGEAAEITRDGLTCFVSDEIETNELRPDRHSMSSQSQELMKEFFYNEIMGRGNPSVKSREDQRAAPIFFYVCDSIYFQLRDIITVELGIDLLKHLLDVAKNMEPFFKDVSQNRFRNEPSNASPYFESGNLFWKNKKVKIDSPDKSVQRTLRSKL